jgi:hypothetical protein
MSAVLLVALMLPAQAPAKDRFADQWKQAIELNAEPIKLDAEGREVVTIRMHIKPKFFVYATPQPVNELEPVDAKLTVKSKDPKTRAIVVYPKGREEKEGPFRWSIYEGTLAFVAIVQRAPGDDSPLECTLRFRPMNQAY